MRGTSKLLVSGILIALALAMPRGPARADDCPPDVPDIAMFASGAFAIDGCPDDPGPFGASSSGAFAIDGCAPDSGDIAISSSGAFAADGCPPDEGDFAIGSSELFTLYDCVPAPITGQPLSATKCVGDSATFSVAVSGQGTGATRWWANGITNLSEDGWSFHLKPGDVNPSMSRDFSIGAGQSWRIYDNNSPTQAYMRGIKDPGGMSSSQGIVMARIRVLTAATFSGGFGYSFAGTGQSMMMLVRPNTIAYKTAMEQSLGSNSAVSPSPVFRIYAFRYYLSGSNLTADAWMSNGEVWSANQTDWTQLIAGMNIAGNQSAYRDKDNNSLTGLLLGSYGPSSATWDGFVDYICYSPESVNQNPWSFNPESPAYQWRKNGVEIDGATSSSYTINPVGTEDSGSYDCVVSDSCRPLTSNAATLTVTQPPPTVTSITPSSGPDTGTTSITNLVGTGFASGATVKLTRTSYSDINASNVDVVNATTITCSLNLTSMKTGLWKVVVTNSDAQSGTLANGFGITISDSASCVGTVISRLLHPIAATASANRQFLVWGTVELIDSSTFWLDDGSGTRIKVFAPGYAGIATGNHASATGTVDVSSLPLILVSRSDRVFRCD